MLKGNEAHTIRERDTPNANPEIKNIRIIGASDNIDLATLVREKIGKQKIRSNAVLAVEMLLSASASYFRPQAPHEAGIYDKQRLENFVEATVNWLHSSWGERIVRAELHLDEITPHIHPYLVPLDERGKLNCRGLFGGRIKLSQLQDSFGNAVGHLGISRGIKGSTATYTTLKKYYAAVNQDSGLLNLEQFFPKAQINETSKEYRQRIIEILTPEFETINYQLNERSRLLQQKAQLEQTALKSERFRQELESELQSLQKSIQTQELPLELVAYELGLNQKKQFSLETHAIDLVMQVNQCEFDDALIWLYDRFGCEPMLTAVKNYAVDEALNIAHQNPYRQFTPPSPSPSHWKQVEYYLRQKHSIPQSLIQILYKRKLIYADIKGNAVFLARNLAGEATGAYLYASTQSSNDFTLHPGSKRSRGWFHLSLGGSSDTVLQAVLVESPIKALQHSVQNTPHKYRTLYLCIDSEYALLPVEFLRNIPTIITPMAHQAAVKNSLPHAMEPNTNNSSQKYKSRQTLEIENSV